MLERSPQQLIAVVVSLLVVTGMMPAVAVGAFTEDATEPQEAISGNNFRDVSDDIEVWERAALPLRANPEVNADTSFRSVDLRASIDELQIDNVPLDKGRTAVYDDQAEIQLEFESKTVASTSDFANQDAQLMAVHIEEDTQAARDLFASSSTLTAAEALDLITEENINSNAHFDLVENYGTLDGDGELTKRYDLGDENRGAGFYVFFLVQDYEGNGNWGVTDKGFEVSNGEISVKNKSRVLGVDVATVHQRPAEATPERSRYNPGSDIGFDVDANQDGNDDVTHAIAVYKRSGQTGFEGKDVSVEITGSLDEDFSADQVTVKREIEDVNGVAKVSGNPEIFGLGNVQDGRVSGLIAGSRIIDFVTEQANSDGPLDATTSNPKTLDASVTVVDGPQEAAVTVETLENWSTGQYGYVYIATGADSSEITTTQGTININPSVTRSGPIQGNGPTELQFPSNANISDVGVTFGNGASGDLTVEQRVSPSKGVPSIKLTKNREDPVYMDISVSGGTDGPATIEVTAKKSSLRGLAENKVSIWHYKNGEWLELETQILSQSGNTVTLRATTDSFSPFALAEAAETNEEVNTPVDDGGSSRSGSSSSGGGGGGGGALGSRTVFSITDFITGGSSVDINVGGSSDTLERISLRFFDQTAGQVKVEERNQPSLSENYPRNYDDTVVTIVDISPPNRVASEPGSVTFEIKRPAVEALGVTAEDLQIQQFDSESSTWETLPTEVVEAEGDTVTIRADVSSFGTYVVSTAPDSVSADSSTPEPASDQTEAPAADQSDDEDIETVTGTATLRPGETAEPAETTSEEFPGLGVGAALVAFVLALVLGWRRRQ